MSDLSTLLTTPPGSLVYHLTLVILLVVVLALAQTHWGRGRSTSARRWALPVAGLLVLRVAILSVSVLSTLGPRMNDAVVAALGHLASFAGALLIGWLFLFPRASRGADLTAAFLLIAMLTASAASAIAPPGEGWIDVAWASAGLAVSLIAMLALPFFRGPERGIGAAACLLLSLGFGLELWALLSSGVDDPLAGLVRLGELAAYPLVTLGAARIFALEGPGPRAEPPGPVAAAGREPAGRTRPAEIVEDVLSLAVAKTSQDVAREAVRAVARAMRVEYCLLITPSTPPEQFAVATGFDLISEQYVEGSPLDERRAPGIAGALEQRRTLAMPPNPEIPDIFTLEVILSLEGPGPALMVPVTALGELYGGLLVLSPYARQAFSDEEKIALESIARALGLRLHQVHLAGGSASDAEIAAQALTEAYRRIESLMEENRRLSEGRGMATPEAIQPQAKDFEALLALNEEARETIQILEAEIERLKAAQIRPSTGTVEEVENLTAELQSVLEELARSRARLAALEGSGADRGGKGLAALDLEALSSIAQDLRNPIAAIRDHTGLLLGETVGRLEPMQRTLLTRVGASVEQMLTLLGDLLQLAEIGTETLALDFRPVDPVESLEQALLQVSDSIRSRSLTLHTDLPADLGSALADPSALTRILVHLLRNAIAASPEGGDLYIAGRVQSEEPGAGAGFLTLSVADTGSGIPAERLGEVFQRRAREDAVPGVGEAGVGLAIARRLSESLGGRVWVNSEMGAGSTFTVLIPLAGPPASPRASS
jgi:signal transduction histidine kinase